MEPHKSLSLKGRRLPFVLPNDSLWFKRFWLDSGKIAVDKSSNSARAGQQMSTRYLNPKSDLTGSCNSILLISSAQWIYIQSPDSIASNLVRPFHLWVWVICNLMLAAWPDPDNPHSYSQLEVLKLTFKVTQVTPHSVWTGPTHVYPRPPWKSPNTEVETLVRELLAAGSLKGSELGGFWWPPIPQTVTLLWGQQSQMFPGHRQLRDNCRESALDP
jgi:hypothetical protein